MFLKEKSFPCPDIQQPKNQHHHLMLTTAIVVDFSDTMKEMIFFVTNFIAQMVLKNPT